MLSILNFNTMTITAKGENYEARHHVISFLNCQFMSHVSRECPQHLVLRDSLAHLSAVLSADFLFYFVSWLEIDSTSYVGH
jgi:hypothetical protein